MRHITLLATAWLVVIAGPALEGQEEGQPCESICSDQVPCDIICWDGVPGSGILTTCGESHFGCLDEPPPPPPPIEAPTLQGRTDCEWGDSRCNPCVSDVDFSLDDLRDHGDISGFHMNEAADVSSDNHWQGIQRLTADGGRFLAVSRSGANVAFVTVHMASRDSTGLRYRSNRIAQDTFFYATPPPLSDGVVHSERSDTGFDHAGGIQAIGDILVVPLENEPAKRSRVVFYNLSDPADPNRLYEFNRREWNATDVGSASAAAAAQLQDGRYLLIVGGKDTLNVDFYVSSGTDLHSKNIFYKFSTLKDGFNKEQYQSLNLVTQCDGRLFVVGAHNTRRSGNGHDWLDWYSIDNGPRNSVKATKIGNHHLYCNYPEGGGGNSRHCNLQAAGGTYIDPDGRLLFYSAEHANNGPMNSVKFEEFRSKTPGTCPTIDQAWADLYADPGYTDRGVILDYADRNLRNYLNYDHVEDFNDSMSGVRWCVPPGWRLRLYEHKNPCGGNTVDLLGSGGISNIHYQGFGDKLSCSRWLHF